jgi:hypothetical protein
MCLSTTGTQGFNTYRKNNGTGSTGWVNMSQTKGAINATSDPSGDITVTHGFGGTPTKVMARINGPTLYHTAVHTVGTSSFKVRVYDAGGTPQAMTPLAGWWEAETTA